MALVQLRAESLRTQSVQNASGLGSWRREDPLGKVRFGVISRGSQPSEALGGDTDKVHDGGQQDACSLDEREREILGCASAWIRASPAPKMRSGEVFSLTRERIRQIEARALSKLRHTSLDRGARGLPTAHAITRLKIVPRRNCPCQ